MNTSQWATDLRTEKAQAYDPYPVDDWFADLDDEEPEDDLDINLPRN